MNIYQRVERFIQKFPKGKPFTNTLLIKFGPRTAINQALAKHTSTRKILRITRGVYVRPEKNRFIGLVLPGSFEVAKTIAQKTNHQIQVSGAEAARQLGLSTQVPMKPLYLTTGPSRRFNLGNLEVKLKHVSEKRIPMAGSRAGLAIVALLYFGKNLIKSGTIEEIEKKLGPQDFKKFMSSTECMPVWMRKAVLKYKENRKGCRRLG